MIALGIDQIELTGLTLDLPAQNEGGTGIKTLGIRPARPPVLLLLGNIELPDVLGDIRYVLGIRDVELGVFF